MITRFAPISAQMVALQAVLGSEYQHTLKSTVGIAGIGLHTGEQVAVELHPAPAQTGRCFLRMDTPTPIAIPASIEALRQTVLSTELGVGTTTVRTVEHLLAALAGLGIDNAWIQVHGSEIPLLDGSAQDWVAALLAVGWTTQAAHRTVRSLDTPLTVQAGDGFVTAVPAEQLTFTYGIDFPYAAIGQQWYTVVWEDFVAEVAPARTFGFAETVDKLRAGGLIKGGSLENALVCGAEGWLNPPLRFPNEPVRHKLLDLIGDLSLLGTLPNAHFLAYKASHTLHTQLVQRLAAFPWLPL